MQCPHPITLSSGDVVPCGKCPSCRANERQEWVFRLQQEARVAAYSVFVTLTYDEEHIPEGYNVNKRDVQLFLKRLRKHFPSGELRYYIVSEYGDHTFRPHYHGLLFFTHEQKNENELFDKITDSWRNGFCKYGKVEEGSIVYCTKYCLKKTETPKGREKVFRLMSKMSGGLGFNYIDEMGVFHVDTSNYSVAYYNGRRSRMPKYYKDLFRRNNPHYREIIDQQQEERYSRDSQQAERDFRAFLRGKHFDTFLDACNAYNDSIKAKIERKEELILKHCKKQIL